MDNYEHDDIYDEENKWPHSYCDKVPKKKESYYDSECQDIRENVQPRKEINLGEIINSFYKAFDKNNKKLAKQIVSENFDSVPIIVEKIMRRAIK